MKLFTIILFLYYPLVASVTVDLISSKFDKPIYAITIPSNNNSILVVEQDGVIRLVENKITNKKFFLDIVIQFI